MAELARRMLLFEIVLERRVVMKASICAILVALFVPALASAVPFSRPSEALPRLTSYNDSGELQSCYSGGPIFGAMLALGAATRKRRA